MNKKIIVCTRPCIDKETACLHYISGELLKKIDDVGEYTIIDLHDHKAVRKEFEKAMEKEDVRLVILNGHGNIKCIYGQGINEIILDERNVKKLNSKIIYAVACDSSREIGNIAISVGNADAYIGYESKFMIVVDPSRSTIPSKDKNIIPFKEVYFFIAIGLISGLSVEKSLEYAKKHVKQLIREYGVLGIRDKYGDAPLIRFALYWNLFCLKARGKLDAII